MKKRARHTCVAILGLAFVGALVGCRTTKVSARMDPWPVPAIGEVGLPKPITLAWDPQLSCVHFSPARITIEVGDRVRFNSSVGQSVTLRISSAAFGVDDTMMVIGANASYTTQRAANAGRYDLDSTPAMCGPPGGGIGPAIVIEETK